MAAWRGAPVCDRPPSRHRECSLCDISHGRLRRKPEFVDMVERLEFAGHRVEVHHRNEISVEQLAVAADALPCVRRALMVLMVLMGRGRSG